MQYGLVARVMVLIRLRVGSVRPIIMLENKSHVAIYCNVI